MNKKLSLRIFEGFSIQRWNDLIRPFDMVEMDKAAEKMVLAYIIGKYEENKGNFIDWEWIIHASFFDLLRKIALCDIKAPVQQMLKREFLDEYMRLLAKQLEASAAGYRDKYELSTRRIDDMRNGIKFLLARHKLALALRDSKTAEEVKKKAVVWRDKMEADQKSGSSR